MPKQDKNRSVVVVVVSYLLLGYRCSRTLFFFLFYAHSRTHAQDAHRGTHNRIDRRRTLFLPRVTARKRGGGGRRRASVSLFM